MAQHLKDIDREDFSGAIPALLALILIPHTCRINQGAIRSFMARGFMEPVMGKAR